MKCKQCNQAGTKAGKTKSGVQRYCCRKCEKYYQAEYRYKACSFNYLEAIRRLIVEGVGIRSAARILEISKKTVLRGILEIAGQIDSRSFFPPGLKYEIDELHSFVRTKSNEVWICYAIERSSRRIVDFIIGSRSKVNLSKITEKVLSFSPSQIFTDRLNIYPGLIPENLHTAGKWGTLRIERKNLNLRTHLKRLSRRTICFSKSGKMLAACLRVYFSAD